MPQPRGAAMAPKTKKAAGKAMQAKVGQPSLAAVDSQAPSSHKSTAGILADMTAKMTQIMEHPAFQSLGSASPPNIGEHQFASQARLKCYDMCT